MASTGYIPNCPHCDSTATTTTGSNQPQPYQCLRCDRQFTDDT